MSVSDQTRVLKIERAQKRKNMTRDLSLAEPKMYVRNVQSFFFHYYNCSNKCEQMPLDVEDEKLKFFICCKWATLEFLYSMEDIEHYPVISKTNKHQKDTFKRTNQ